MGSVSLLDSSIIKQQIDQRLRLFYKEQLERASLIDAAYSHLWEATAQLGLAGGKRVRPYLCLLAYSAFNGPETAAMIDVATAQELLHLSLLIIDDIIDRDDKRYGQLNVSGHYKQQYQKLYGLTGHELTHAADNAALLAGNLVLSGAHSMIAESRLPAKDIAVAQNCLQQALFTTAGGELLDTESTHMNIDDVKPLRIAELKTAAYSFIGPLQTGALMAHADADQVEQLKVFGLNLGIAFQLADDIIGVMGDPAQSGKSNTSDLEEAKATYLLQTTLLLASSTEADYIRSIIGKPGISSNDLNKVQQLIKSTGGLEKTVQQVTTYRSRAIDALDKLNFTAESRLAFKQLIDSSTKEAL